MFTKTISLALATVLGTATLAAADTSYFSLQNTMGGSDTLDLGVVTAAGNGTVSIYDYRLGTQGKLLGSEAVNAGANSDVRVDVGTAPIGDVIAVLTVNGQIVATRDIQIDRM
jgi:hypothetical protein